MLTAKLSDKSWSWTKGDVLYEGHLLALALLKVKIESAQLHAHRHQAITKLTPPFYLSRAT